MSKKLYSDFVESFEKMENKLTSLDKKDPNYYMSYTGTIGKFLKDFQDTKFSEEFEYVQYDKHFKEILSQSGVLYPGEFYKGIIV